jgi:hypothetical protein
MELSNFSSIEHLVVNRAEITSEGCRACGRSFACAPAGARALSVAVGQDSQICVFCVACGERIMKHLQASAARQRYGWDWLVPLHRRPSITMSDASVEAIVQREPSPPSANGAGLHTPGETYDSERVAIISLLSKVYAGEANGSEAFAAWAAVCSTECLKMGLRIIAEREAYHARIFHQRLLELGAEKRGDAPEEGRGFKEYLGDPNIPDSEKLLRFTRSVGDPAESIRPLRDFAALIREDVQTREVLLLFAEDELSSATWALKSCASLNQAAKTDMAFVQAQCPVPA